MALHRRGLALGLCIVALGLAGCSTVRDEMGLGRSKPDEFSVVPRAPLAMPPDMSALRLPSPGAPRPQQLSPAGEAKAALSQTRGAVATPAFGATVSAGERALIDSAGAIKTDGKVRNEMAEELREQRAPKSITERALFWRGSEEEVWVVDAAAEERRIQRAQRSGEVVTGKGTPIIEKSTEKGLIGRVF